MLFCPICSTCLLVEKGSKNFQLFCKTCEYTFPIIRKVKNTIKLSTKQVDDVLGGKEAWENVDQIEADCPKCSHKRAYYKQIQIRSGDEPMTIFFRCCNEDCHFQWREG